MVGSSTTQNRGAYRFDTISNTYTKLKNIPFDFYRGNAYIIDNFIYLSSGNGANSYMYKYNIETDTYTKLTNIPSTGISYIEMVGYEDALYIVIRSNTSSKPSSMYKYDILTDTYLLLNTLPIHDFNKIVLINEYIYIFTNDKNNYKYNILNNSYSEISDTPEQYTFGLITNIESNIFLLPVSSASSYTDCNIYVYDAETTNNIYVEPNIGVRVQIEKNLQTYFTKAYIVENNKIKNYPCYYGNGEEWQQIEPCNLIA